MEWQMRVLVGNIRWMKHKHYAYIGSMSHIYYISIVEAKHEMSGEPSLLEIIMLPGDHFSVYPRAIEMYLNLIEIDIAK